MITQHDLKVMRAIRRKTQFDMADELGISVQKYKRWEMNPTIIPKIAYERLESMLRETTYKYEG